MAPTESIIERIRKMIRLANDAGATEGERDNAMRMAHKTLAKYNLDLAAVMESKDQKAESGEKREHVKAKFFGQVWARSASASIAELFFCNYFYRKLGANTDHVSHSFIGRHSNAVTAQEIAAFVVKAINKEAMAYRNRHHLPYESYRAFAAAASVKVSQRCQDMRQEQEDEQEQVVLSGPPGTALVLAKVYDDEKAGNAAYMEQLGVILSKKKSPGMHDANDYHAMMAGARFGEQVSLTPQLSGSKR